MTERAHLLPPNATALERAASLAIGPLTTGEGAIATTQDPLRIPAALLPHLALGEGVPMSIARSAVSRGAAGIATSTSFQSGSLSDNRSADAGDDKTARATTPARRRAVRERFKRGDSASSFKEASSSADTKERRRDTPAAAERRSYLCIASRNPRSARSPSTTLTGSGSGSGRR